MLEDQLIEFAAQAAGIDLLAAEPDKRPLFASIGRTRFSGVNITPGMALKAIQYDTETDGKKKFKGSSRVETDDGTLVAEISDMQAVIVSPAVIRRGLGVK